jgi:Holliday junction resolvase
MGNRNYERGRAKEYRVKKQYEKLGCIVIRASGSHGFADLVALHPLKRHIFFLQVKPKNFSKSQTTRLLNQFNFINDNWVCTFEVV